MDAKKFNEFESQIDIYLNEIRYFNSFYEKIKDGNHRNLYDETMKHANAALELYGKLISNRELLQGHRNILEREKNQLDDKLDLLERKPIRKRELIGV